MNDFSANPPQTEGHTLSWSFILSRSYRLYADRFWTYFRIALFPALAAIAFHYIEPFLGDRLLHLGSVPAFSARWIFTVLSFGWTTGAVYWTLSVFFFSAIAATLEEATSPEMQAITDAFTMPRRRLAALIAYSLFTWTLFYIARALVGYATVIVLGYLGVVRNSWALFAGISFALLLAAGLIAKFALAVPQLMKDKAATVRNALRDSLRLTNGWEIFFMMFLIKSAAVGSGVYWIAGYGMRWLWGNFFFSPTIDSVMEWIIYIFLAASLESPLFIAFSVLYSELQKHPKSSAPAGLDQPVVSDFIQ